MDKKTPEIVIAIAVAIVLSYFLIGNPTGQVIFEPDTPENCTDSNITAIWDSIFKETSSGITTIINDSSETSYCDNDLCYGGIKWLTSLLGEPFYSRFI